VEIAEGHGPQSAATTSSLRGKTARRADQLQLDRPVAELGADLAAGAPGAAGARSCEIAREEGQTKPPPGWP